MSITAEHDPNADALYVRLSDAPRGRTVEFDDVTYVDIDDEGRAMGIEFLYPSMGLHLDAVARQLGLQGQIPQIVSAIHHSGVMAEVPTFTGGGSILASLSVQTTVHEGTVAAGQSVATAGMTHVGQPFVHTGGEPTLNDDAQCESPETLGSLPRTQQTAHEAHAGLENAMSAGDSQTPQLRTPTESTPWCGVDPDDLDWSEAS